MKELLRRMGFGFVLFGLMLMVIAVSAPGPLVGRAGGIAAAPLAVPAFVIGIVLVLWGLFMLLRWRS